MFSVYQHWDPLKVCVVGQSYPPEFYSWITVPHVRKLFERIAIETEEDFQKIIAKLKSFGVTVLRTELPHNPMEFDKIKPPPICPRDHTAMVGQTFYTDYRGINETLGIAYNNIKDLSWPDCKNVDDFYNLPAPILKECIDIHKFNDSVFCPNPYTKIVEFVRQQGNKIKTVPEYPINAAMLARLGKDLYFGTEFYNVDKTGYKNFLDHEFTQTRNHIVNTGGHSDGTYCPVCPGLIISLKDVPTYATTFPDWEVVYLPGQSWNKVRSFLDLKQKNGGKWWIPGFEHDQDVINTVEQWLGHWTGYVEETVFDVNMLIIDPKNVIVFNYNKLVFDAFKRHDITPHIVNFRHRYFWDGGVHCVTTDLHREGSMQDYFPQRS